MSSSWTLRSLSAALVAICVTLVALVNTIDINLGAVGAEEQIGLDVVVLSKLAISGLCALVGVIGLVMMPSARSLLMGGPGLLLVSISMVFIVTSLFAIEQVATVCRIASILVLVYVGFAAVALQSLGLRNFAIAMLVGLLINLLANWFVFAFVKSIGIYTEDLGGGIEVQRMGGLGHPNAIARLAILASLIVIAWGRWRGDSRQDSDSKLQGTSWRRSFLSPLAIAIHLFSIATIYATYSRTAALAGLISAGVMVGSDLWSRRGAATITVVMAALLFLGSGFALVRGQDASLANRSVLGAVTKTGNLSELTSATGRTEIWGETIRLIQQRPITGYGLNSAPVMLDAFSYHTHNSLLHAAFSGGLVAGFLMFLLLLWNVVFGLTDSAPLVRGVTIFLLISGLFEDTVLETFAGPATLIWFVVLLVPAWRWVAGNDNDDPRDANFAPS